MYPIHQSQSRPRDLSLARSQTVIFRRTFQVGRHDQQEEITPPSIVGGVGWVGDYLMAFSRSSRLFCELSTCKRRSESAKQNLLQHRSLISLPRRFVFLVDFILVYFIPSFRQIIVSLMVTVVWTTAVHSISASAAFPSLISPSVDVSMAIVDWLTEQIRIICHLPVRSSIEASSTRAAITRACFLATTIY